VCGAQARYIEYLFKPGALPLPSITAVPRSAALHPEMNLYLQIYVQYKYSPIHRRRRRPFLLVSPLCIQVVQIYIYIYILGVV